MLEHRVYIDTSAYLAILLGEKNAALIEKKLKTCYLCSSTFLFLEAERNLVRMVRNKDLSEKNYDAALVQLRNDVELFTLKDFNLELCLTRNFPPVRTPRSSDLVHLRTASWFLDHGGLYWFCTLDDQQRKAAEDFGLPTSI